MADGGYYYQLEVSLTPCGVCFGELVLFEVFNHDFFLGVPAG